MPVLVTYKFDKDQIEGDWENVETAFTHYMSMGTFYCHGNHSFDRIFPYPKNATDKIWVKLVNWSCRYFCSKVWTMDNGRRMTEPYYSISSPFEPSTPVSQKESFQPLTVYTSFYDLINVYSRRSGANNPRGQNFDVNRNLLSIRSFI